MWGFADTRGMVRRQWKALDMFALGLIWAELLTSEAVLKSVDKGDPQKLRLLEILQKVDRPADANECEELGFKYEVCSFVQSVMSDNHSAVREVLQQAPEWKGNAKQGQILQLPNIGIRRWVKGRMTGVAGGSDACELIRQATRFSYRERITVLALMQNEYFKSLYAADTDFHAPHIDDVRDALEHETTEQVAARRSRMTGEEVALASAVAEESVGRVNAMVREQVGQVQANRTRGRT